MGRKKITFASSQRPLKVEAQPKPVPEKKPEAPTAAAPKQQKKGKAAAPVKEAPAARAPPTKGGANKGAKK